MPLAYAYSRFSTSEQLKGDSLARQQSRVDVWARANPEHKIELFDDRGVSAWKGANATVGQLAQFLDKLRSNQLEQGSTLLIENFDRLSRQAIEEAQTLFLEIVQKGTTIVTLHNNKAYRRPLSLVDIMTALIEMDIAHQESQKKSERVRAAYASRRVTGKVMHTAANTPRWLSLVDRERFEPIPERVAIIREIFELAAEGMGQFRIAKHLAAAGHKPWGKGKFWHASNIQKIIRGRMVLGTYVAKVDGKEVTRTDYFPAVIPTDLWQRANDRSVRRTASRGASHDERNLVRGIAVSAVDGTAMVHRKGVAATPEMRAVHNKIAYLRTQLKSAKGKAKSQIEKDLSAAIKARQDLNAERAAGNRPGYVYAYERLASMATISTGTKTPHWVDYRKVESRLIEFVQAFAPQLIARSRSGVVDTTAAELAAARDDLAKAQKMIKKLAKTIIGDEDPSPTLISTLKDWERAEKAAGKAVERAEIAAARPTGVPQIRDAALVTPEGRREVRAQLARWINRLEIGRDYLSITIDGGLVTCRVPFEGPLIDMDAFEVHVATADMHEETEFDRIRAAEALIQAAEQRWSEPTKKSGSDDAGTVGN